MDSAANWNEASIEKLAAWWQERAAYDYDREYYAATLEFAGYGDEIVFWQEEQRIDYQRAWHFLSQLL